MHLSRWSPAPIRGIGLETARRLAGAGYRVYLTARSSERGRDDAATAGAQFLELDVTSGESVRHAAGCVEQAGGTWDVLVNNAGITGPVRDDPHNYTADDMTEVLLTNVVGCIRLIHNFLRCWRRATDPRIVNVSSGLGSFTRFHDQNRIGAFVGTPVYAASKPAINMMTVQFASLLPNIRINAADPGLTATDVSRGQGHSIRDGTDAIIAFALAAPGGPSGIFADRDGTVPW